MVARSALPKGAGVLLPSRDARRLYVCRYAMNLTLNRCPSLHPISLSLPASKSAFSTASLACLSMLDGRTLVPSPTFRIRVENDVHSKNPNKAGLRSVAYTTICTPYAARTPQVTLKASHRLPRRSLKTWKSRCHEMDANTWSMNKKQS